MVSSVSVWHMLLSSCAVWPKTSTQETQPPAGKRGCGTCKHSCLLYCLYVDGILPHTHHTPCVMMVWISFSGPKTHPPIPAEAERELLGNGEWPYPLSSGSTSQHVSIPPPPQEGVDHAPKMAYKMTAKPRGIGKLFTVVIFDVYLMHIHLS